MFSFASQGRDEGEFKESVSAVSTDYRWANREDRSDYQMYDIVKEMPSLCVGIAVAIDS